MIGEYSKRLVVCLAGLALYALGTVFGVLAGSAGTNGWNTMAIVSKAFPKLPVGLVKYILETIALVSGLMMGAPFGVGTVLVIALQASLFQFACHVCRFVPREAASEDLADTWKRIRGSR
jgi:uncharacterized membrane protein YczE